MKKKGRRALSNMQEAKRKEKTGVKGFEPLNIGIKIRRLATWLYSKLIK